MAWEPGSAEGALKRLDEGLQAARPFEEVLREELGEVANKLVCLYKQCQPLEADGQLHKAPARDDSRGSRGSRDRARNDSRGSKGSHESRASALRTAPSVELLRVPIRRGSTGEDSELESRSLKSQTGNSGNWSRAASRATSRVPTPEERGPQEADKGRASEPPPVSRLSLESRRSSRRKSVSCSREAGRLSGHEAQVPWWPQRRSLGPLLVSEFQEPWRPTTPVSKLVGNYEALTTFVPPNLVGEHPLAVPEHPSGYDEYEAHPLTPTNSQLGSFCLGTVFSPGPSDTRVSSPNASEACRRRSHGGKLDCLMPAMGNTQTMKSTFSMNSARSDRSRKSLFGITGAVPAISEAEVDELVFEVLPLWSESKPQILKSTGTLMPQTPYSRRSRSSTAGLKKSFGLSTCLPVVSPNSLQRLVWDLLSICCIIHDTAMAPLEFLQVPQDAAMLAMDWCARTFWTCDIGATFCTGIQLSDGSVELRRCKIARSYLLTWFFLDFVIVLVDWLAVTLDEAAMASQLIGMLRMLRLVRLLRLQKLVVVAAERARSERVSLLLNLLGSVGAIVGVAHAMASAWLGLGRSRPTSWISERGLSQDAYFEQYSIALHWSVTNFAGSMDLQPVNQAERVFAVVSLLVGFLVASWLVSSITSSMTRLSIISSKKTVQFAVLNKYLKEHGISGDLVRRVLLNAKHAFSEKEEHMQEADVELLKLVSEPLRAELHLEIYSPAMICHPLFYQLKVNNPRAIQQICHMGVSMVALEEGDIAFSRGEVPHIPKVLFVLSGMLHYARDGCEQTLVSCNQWVSEQVLWTSWVYHGSLQASNSCRILVLDAKLFWRIGGQLGRLEIANYACRFVQWQNSSYEARSDVGNEEESIRITQEVFGRGPRWSYSHLFGLKQRHSRSSHVSSSY